MWRKSVGLLTMFCVGGLLMADTLPTGKDKSKGARKGEVAAKVIKVDLDKKTVTLAPEGGKEKAFNLSDKVTITGPNGGKATFADKRLAAGKTVFLTMDGGALKKIRLDFRSRTKKDKGNDKDDAKAKDDAKDKKAKDKGKEKTEAPKGKIAAVDGKVSVDGKPLAKGKLSFRPEKGKAIAVEVKDGKYSATKIPFGTYRVTVSGSGVPRKYSGVKTTSLEAKLTKASQNLDFSLKK
jgi:hypothetical protein